MWVTPVIFTPPSQTDAPSLMQHSAANETAAGDDSLPAGEQKKTSCASCGFLRRVNAQFYAKGIVGNKKATKSLTPWQSSSISPHVHKQSISGSSFLLIFYIHITSSLCCISNRSSSSDLPPRLAATGVFTTRQTSEVSPVIELQNCWQPGNADQRTPPVLQCSWLIFIFFMFSLTVGQGFCRYYSQGALARLWCVTFL